MHRIETHATPFPCMVNMAKKDSGKALFKCHFRNTLCLCFKMSPNLCKTFHMKMSFICMKMNLWVDTFSYKINGFARRLALTRRQRQLGFRPHCYLGIWKRSFISTVRITVKTELFKNALQTGGICKSGISFSCERIGNNLKTEFFKNDDVT